jgi:surface protein
MCGMFENARTFNQPLNWKLDKVVTITSMFKRAKAFNQPLDSWNTHQVTSMALMFEGAKSFNKLEIHGKFSTLDTSKKLYLFEVLHLMPFKDTFSLWAYIWG